MKRIILLLNFLLLALLSGHSLAAALEKIQFLKISPQDHRAVMKTAEDKLQLVGIGDVIDEATIVEIVEGRIVLERPGDAGKETVIVRFDGKRQRIEVIRPLGEKPPVMTAPEKPRNAGESGGLGYR